MSKPDYSTMPDSFLGWWWWRLVRYPAAGVIWATVAVVLGIVGIALGAFAWIYG